MMIWKWQWAAVALLAPTTVLATLPDRVMVDTYEELAEGTSRSVSISDLGFLEPAPAAKEIAGVNDESEKDVQAGQVWAVLPEAEGGAYLLATSPEGRLLRVTSDGTVSLVTKFEETHLYALARNPKTGDMFVASSPDGKIYRLVPGEKAGTYVQPESWFDPAEKYIWCLAFDEDGVMYAGTGTDGKVYRVTGKDKGDVYYDSDETHIRSLAFAKDKTLLAGSADNGYLYRITGKDNGVVLAASGAGEVNRIIVAPDGVVYFSGVGKAKQAPKPGSSAKSTARVPAALQALMSAAKRNGNGGAAAAMAAAKAKASANGSTGKSSGQAARLFRLDGSQFAEVIWTTKESILTLDWHEGRAYVGTGGEGYFYAITPRGEATRLVQVDGESISASALLANGQFALGTSNPVRLFRVGGKRQGPGEYESGVIDSGTFARWGSVTVKSRGEATVTTRSGNTPEPDKSWYDWKPLRNNQSQSQPARYLQVKLEIAKGSVDRFEVVYLPRNLPPRVAMLDIFPPGVGFQAIMPPPQPPQARTADQLIKMAEKGDYPLKSSEPPARFMPEKSRGLRTAVWKASDPNGDELKFVVYYRTDTDPPTWRLLADKVEETVLSWDSSGWPDGNYYLKVIASDAAENAEDDDLRDELISKMMTVDNSPPKIRITSVGNGRVEFVVTDDASMLLEVTVSRNGREFSPVRPSDGILDARTERFVTKLAPGKVLFIRAEDEAGNVSSALAEGK